MSMLLHVNVTLLLMLLSIHCMHGPHFTYSPSEEHLTDFQLFASTNIAVIQIQMLLCL